MDRYDSQILQILQREGRISWSELGERVNLSASAAQRRVQALISDGVLTGFGARLDAQNMGLQVRALVEVNIERSNKSLAEKFRRHIRETPEVLACYMVSGSVDYVLEVIVEDLNAYAAFIEEKVLKIEGVKDASSKIVLQTIKPASPLPT